MNTPAQRFNEARAYLLRRGVTTTLALRITGAMKGSIFHDLWTSRIEPTAEHLPIIERIEAIVTKLQTT